MKNVMDIRADFPAVLKGTVTYLDNAATTQKPSKVIDSLAHYYREGCSNIHRSDYNEADKNTRLFEEARVKVANFIGASSSKEIIFTKNATESLNLLASTLIGSTLKKGDIMLISQLEHHANIIPWQMHAARHGVEVQIIPIDANGDIYYEALEKLLSPKVKLLAVTGLSNVLGTKVDLYRITAMAKNVGCLVVADLCQAMAHYPVSVHEIGCDFAVFSGHKLYAPTGVGVLYGRYSLLESMAPYQVGGGMVDRVGDGGYASHVFRGVPWRFEAGTQPIAEAIALGVALDYITDVGWESIERNERATLKYLLETLKSIKGIKVVGDPRERVAVVSFIHDNISSGDISTLLDRQDIAVRAGHHCAQPLLHHLKLSGTVRASLALYNNMQDIDKLGEALHKVNKIMGI